MTWDKYRAELTDTMRGQHSARPARPCKYCGDPTKSIFQVCCKHTDLIDLDPFAPAPVAVTEPEALGVDSGSVTVPALEKARTPTPDAELAAEFASPPGVLAVSSAAAHVQPGRTNGDPTQGCPAAVALDNLEEA